MTLDIEALAREARERDHAREALAVALEWPDEEAASQPARRVRAWVGWVALGGALVLAGVAGTAALMLEPRVDNAAYSKPPAALKMERQLSLPR
jgi:hypothetical protein